MSIDGPPAAWALFMPRESAKTTVIALTRADSKRRASPHSATTHRHTNTHHDTQHFSGGPVLPPCCTPLLRSLLSLAEPASRTDRGVGSGTFRQAAHKKHTERFKKKEKKESQYLQSTGPYVDPQRVKNSIFRSPDKSKWLTEDGLRAYQHVDSSTYEQPV